MLLIFDCSWASSRFLGGSISYDVVDVSKPSVHKVRLLIEFLFLILECSCFGKLDKNAC